MFTFLPTRPSHAEGMDCWDCMDAASESIRDAKRAGKGAERYQAIKEAQSRLSDAAELAETEILFRWQSIGRDAIIPEDVAPAADFLSDLARDMKALGWRYVDGRYRRPEPPLMRGNS